MAHLDKCYQEAQKERPNDVGSVPSLTSSISSKILEDPVLKYCPNVQSNDAKSEVSIEANSENGGTIESPQNKPNS